MIYVVYDDNFQVRGLYKKNQLDLIKDEKYIEVEDDVENEIMALEANGNSAFIDDIDKKTFIGKIISLPKEYKTENQILKEENKTLKDRLDKTESALDDLILQVLS